MNFLKFSTEFLKEAYQTGKDNPQVLAMVGIGYALVALVEELRKSDETDKLGRLRQQVVSGDGNISGVSQSIG
jgi:hypothetical protein